jgi:hypothetical protein
MYAYYGRLMAKFGIFSRKKVFYNLNHRFFFEFLSNL